MRNYFHQTFYSIHKKKNERIKFSPSGDMVVG